MSSSTQPPSLCITGANGFIGTWLVKTLLDHPTYKSHTLHCTILPSSPSSHLLSLSPTVSVFEADILDYDALSSAIKGCVGVFHVASPCTLEDPDDPVSEVVDPAVKGTRNVLEACRVHGVKRVVITSSISALVPNPGWECGRVFDEGSWTDVDYCVFRQKWYPVSKTLAEKAAWEFSEKHGLDVVTINPATCLGPLLQPGLNASCAVLQQLLQGSTDTQEYHWLGAVHVKDVARAQILLLETPSASGRYLCSNGIYQFGDFAAKVAELFPEYPVHRFSGETQPGLVPCKEAAKKLIDLGLEFTPFEEAIKETVESLKAKGFLDDPKPRP
ncbi:hypothetical protein vseg_019670 [Gypsophila vaccaria]